MKKILLALALGSAALLSVVSSQAGVSSGLLLGISEGGSYRTLWIAPQNGTLSLRQGRDILVPRKSGWWRVGSSTTVKSSNNESSSKQILWANTAAGTTGGLKPDFEADCQEDQSTALLFVHEQYMAFEEASGGYCKGAAHPWAVTVLQVRDLDKVKLSGGTYQTTNLTDIIEPLSAIGNAAQTKFVQAGEAFHKRLSADKKDIFESTPNVANWALIRRAGQWVIRGRLGYTFEAARGACCIDFDTGLTPPVSLVGSDKLVVPFATLRTKYPNMTDTFASPKGDVQYIFEKKRLLAFAVQNGKLGGLLLTVPLNNANAVMIEWANVGSVARWTRDTAKFLK